MKMRFRIYWSGELIIYKHLNDEAWYFCVNNRYRMAGSYRIGAAFINIKS